MFSWCSEQDNKNLRTINLTESYVWKRERTFLIAYEEALIFYRVKEDTVEYHAKNSQSKKACFPKVKVLAGRVWDTTK